jgi:hypothetical protein
MNIQGVTPNFNNEPVNQKSVQKSTTNPAGPSFSQNFADVARQANVTIANGSTANQAQLSRQKEDFDPLFSFCDAEEELLEESMAKITKLLDELKK